MVRLLLLFLLVVLLNAVGSGQMSRVSLPVDEKFSTDVRVEYTKGQIPRTYMVGKINGVEYRYFNDDTQGIIEGTKGYGTESVLGSSDPKNWRFRCQRSEKSDQKQCSFSKEGIAIVTYTTDRATNTWIGLTNFSIYSSDLSIFAEIVRVDGVEVYNSRNRQFSTDALSLMLAGEILTLYRGHDPDGITTYNLYGFREALKLCEWAIKKVQ